jgi:hypothetical protein
MKLTERVYAGVIWINVSQERVQWRTLVNTGCIKGGNL